MPFSVLSAKVEIEFACLCGEKGFVEVDGFSYVGDLFGVPSMSCPSCGAVLENIDDLEDFSYDSNYEEEEEEEED